MSKFTAITFSRLKDEVERYLQNEYNKANMLFNTSSPYGQILMVLENLHELSMMYLKNTINQFDLGDANSKNERVIKNAAILAGHIPTRAISATGTLRLIRKAGIDLDKELPGGIVVLNNRLNLKNKTNSLDYSLNLGKFKIELNARTTNSFFLPIIQGKWQDIQFTGTGDPMQTFQVLDQGSTQVENFNYEVLVNGISWTIKKHVYDLLPDEEACVVRTGFNGGISVIFGNSGFGKIPELTALIIVRFLNTDGSIGNIYRRDLNDWNVVDDVVDINGNDVDLEKVFDFEIYNDINFGADAESYLFTKSLLPIASNNFVLALPQQYAYELKKLGVFTHVNAEEKNGTIFIYLVPDITLFKRQEEDYFSIPIKNTTSGSVTTTSAFELDSYERSKIVNYLKSGGNIQLTRKFIVKSPKLSFYTMNVWVIAYSDATDDSVKSQIVSVVSNYFLAFNKIDRVPKSDMIKLISNITDIQSVKIEFVCKKNEDYHSEGLKAMAGKVSFDASKFYKDPSSSNSSYDPNKMIGLDPQLGDILFDADEIPVMRGGWYDRNSNFYTDDPPTTASTLSAVNIFIKSKVDPKNKNGI
jgi:hypothetical protein